MSSAPVIDFGVLQGLKKDCDDLVTLEATVVTGFEDVAREEAMEKLQLTNVSKYKGRIIFDIPPEKVKEVLKLRLIDNVWVLIGSFKELNLVQEKEKSLATLVGTVESLLWEKGLRTWKDLSGFEGDLFYAVKNKEKTGDADEEVEKKKLKVDESVMSSIPKFRCTCYRTGGNHNFGSMDAARDIGGALHDKFQWKVQMKNFDIEVVVNVDEDQVYHGITLTKESLFRRSIEHFGPTTLRSTICAALLKLAVVKPGDIVVDPMCGGGSIPIEGALAYSQGFHLAGDLNDKAKTRARDNVKALEGKQPGKSLPIDIAWWDVTRMPLRNSSVDVFVTDLPFGKRSGSKADNRVLYPKVLNSMARVVRPSTGRAVLLTQDKTSMFKSSGKYNKYWKTNRQMYCNIGGLAALVFVMTRTAEIPPSA